MSPYSAFLSTALWIDMSHDFTSVCCSLLGFSFESPLFTCVAAGGLSLPKHLKVASLLQGKSLKFQPVELDLGHDYQFHPIFACPVSREQTTAENPPMLLSCGHVISKISMTKLAKGNARLKCPYCPTEVSTTRALQVTF